MKYDPHKSSLFDLDANIAAILVYLLPWLVSMISDTAGTLAWIIPLAAFLMESKSDFVNFHAANSLSFFVISAFLNLISTMIGLTAVISTWLSSIWVLGLFYMGTAGLIAILLGLVFLIIDIYLLVGKVLSLVNAYSYKDIHFPIIAMITHFILSMKR